MAKKVTPRVVIFAGPNGAGKSTHADAILATLGINTFVNADYSFALFLRQLKVQGYQVAMGGHDVPTDVIRRRFDRSLSNFFSLYTPLADRWLVFDNSVTGTAVLLAQQEGDNLQIKETNQWHKLQKRIITC